MPATVTCKRCGLDAAAIEGQLPLPGDLADEVKAGVCGDCFKQWELQEVMVINELRLNFMDPGAAEVLHRRMREFLGLAPPSDG